LIAENGLGLRLQGADQLIEVFVNRLRQKIDPRIDSLADRDGARRRLHDPRGVGIEVRSMLAGQLICMTIRAR